VRFLDVHRIDFANSFGNFLQFDGEIFYFLVWAKRHIIFVLFLQYQKVIELAGVVHTKSFEKQVPVLEIN
jgi:hypothetical protein